MSFIPPVSEFQFGSTSASGGAVSAPAPIPSCTPPSVPPFTPISQPQSTNPFTTAMSWGVPTCEGTSVTGQQSTTFPPNSQPSPILFKPQPTFQPPQYQQPPQQQYHYSEMEDRYDDEEEGWVPPQQPRNQGRGPLRRAPPPAGQHGYNDHHTYGNRAQPLHFAQPRRQSVASHFQPREYDDSSPIYIPDNINSQVEIRPQLLGILPEFRGYKHDDPYNHLYEFLVIANANNPRNTDRDIFRLRLFPFTLKDKAKYWFTSLPSNSITTWDQFKAKFLQEFYPASKTTEIRRTIQDFQQKPGEAFHEAFERLKELLRSCPHHEIPRWQLVRIFFEGVSETHQAMINASSSGTFMWQDPEEAWQFLEQLSNGSKANFSTRKNVGTAAAVGAEADWKKEVKKEIGDLNKKFDRLMATLQNGPPSSSQGGQGGPKPQEANQVYGQGQGQYNNGRPYMPYNQGQQQNFRPNNHQGQSSNQPRTYPPANNNNNNSNGNTNGNRGPNNSATHAAGTQEEMITKMYEMITSTQQQSQANAKAIANMERQIGQMAENKQKRDDGKLPSTTEINPTHGQRAGKEHVNTVESEWRKVTLEDLFEVGDQEENEEVLERSESDKDEDKGSPVEEGTQPEIKVQKEEQSAVAGIKQKKKDKKGKKKQEAPKTAGPLINQPRWDELKDAPEDTRILQEMCEQNGKNTVPTPKTVRLTVKASEALLGTLPKKEKDPGSPLITTTVGDVVIRNTLLDLGASVNILPGYLYDKYKNEEIEPAKVVLQLADQSTKVSRGKLTNVIIKVGDFFYPVDFLVMEYESLDDAPALILGRPFLATAGAVIDCKTGDVDISFGTRKRRLNVFGNPVSLPSENDNEQQDRKVLMEPGVRSKKQIWTRTGEGGKKEILKETRNHPLATVEKEQLLDLMEMLELRYQQYEKESREREVKVFKLLESQQQWISGVSDRMTQLTSLLSMMANNFIPGFQQMSLQDQEGE
ncbi:hypothetical protein L1887_16761 [Cichorium endivia]|nr:hypothetical protein L1887_16761 [Cichorium endivia]